MNWHSIQTTVLVLVATVSLTGCSLLGCERVSQLVESDGRFESTEAGIALAFPDGWLLEARPTTGDVGLASTLDPDTRALLVPVVAALPGHRHDRCVVVDATSMVQARSDRPALVDVVDEFGASLESDRRWVGIETALIDLPAGRVGRILRDRANESESGSTYVFTRGSEWYYLECVTHSDPSEDWRSIAKTFEFLPLADALAPEGSVERRSPLADAASTATPDADAEVFVEAMCSAFDELLTAVGNPDTGEASVLSETLDGAIERGDAARVDVATEAILGHLQAARSAAKRAGAFPSAQAGISEFDDFLVMVAESVAAKRDAAPHGLDAANAAANRMSAQAYGLWRGWISELGPIWNEVARDMPLPCPSPRG